MIPTFGTRIFICMEDTDMRKSFDSLSGIIRRSMNLDPLSGFLFVFKNRRSDRIKIVYWDVDGMAMWYKALQKGTFKFPDLAHISSAGVEIEPSTLRLILDGIDLSSIRRQQRFRVDAPQVVSATILPDEPRYDSSGAERHPREPASRPGRLPPADPAADGRQ